MTPLTSLSFKPVLLLREFNTSAWSPGEGERLDDGERQRKRGKKREKIRETRREEGTWQVKATSGARCHSRGGISHEADSEVALTAEEIERFGVDG